MHEVQYVPRPEFQRELDAATPSPRDFALYCGSCEWIGERNAAHARSSVCPACHNHGVRIWSHIPEGRRS